MTVPITLTEKNPYPDFDPKTDRIVRLLSGKLALMSFEFEPNEVYDPLLSIKNESNGNFFVNIDFWTSIEEMLYVKGYITVSDDNVFVCKIFYRDNDNTLHVLQTGNFPSWNEAEQALSAYILKTEPLNF